MSCFLLLSLLLIHVHCDDDSKLLITVYHVDGKDTFDFVNVSDDEKMFNDFQFAAISTFNNKLLNYGWNALSVMTSPKFPDVYQSYWAGFLETNATLQVTRASWMNTVEGLCVHPFTEECIRLEDFLRTNIRYSIEQSIRMGDVDPFWYQVGLMAWQMKGMSDAYRHVFVRDSTSLTNEYLLTLQDDVLGIYLLQLSGDLSDILQALSLHGLIKRLNPMGFTAIPAPSCSALIKVTTDNVILSHVTWSPYQMMLRVLKHYNFPWKVTASAKKRIPGYAISFSSYPSVLSSVDDFYLTSARLVTIETTNSLYNKTLLQLVRDGAKNLILEPFRVMTANRLATSGSEWVSYFKRQNSGTYNNQWMIFDAKRYTPGSRLQRGVLTVAEQLPGIVVSDDVTDVLERQTYWASYNIPYYPVIYNMSGMSKQKEKYGIAYDYEKTARSQIFKRDHKNVVDLATMHRMMRYNDFKHDPLSRCNCSPPYTAELAISARCDLNDPNGTYPLSMFAFRLHGGTDVKITDYKLIYTLNMIATSGPTYDDVPPFQWSKVPIRVKKPHMHPDRWQFSPVQTNFTDYSSMFNGKKAIDSPKLIPVF